MFGAVQLPSESVTSTAPRIGCESLYAAYLQNGSAANAIAYNLCLAEQKILQLGLDAGHLAWSALSGLWDEFAGLFQGAGSAVGNAATKAWAAAKSAGSGLITGAEGAVKGLWDKTLSFLQWLDDQAAHVLDWFGGAGMWILGALGLWAVIELAPVAANLTARRR
jgi:hypothetical protein